MAGPPGKSLSLVCFEFKRDVKEMGQPIHWSLWGQGWVHANTLGSYSDSHSPRCVSLILTLNHRELSHQCEPGYGFIPGTSRKASSPADIVISTF